MIANPLRQKKYKSQKVANATSKTISYILLVILSLVWIIPILWIVLNAFRVEYQPDGTYVGGIAGLGIFFPTRVGFDNFVKLWNYAYATDKSHSYLRWMGNTMLIAVCCCLISTFLILSVAYCMSKLRFKLRKPFMNITMVLGLFPGFMSMIAIYFILKSVGLCANPNAPHLAVLGLILAYSAGSGLGFQVAKGFFDVLPNSLVESAKLDGCTNFKIFWKIILPLSKPIIIYTALMSFTGPWMDFIFAKVILGTDSDFWTVSVGLYNMMYGGETTDTSVFTIFCAGCTCVAIPIVTLFMCLQRYYVEGVTAGAVKG